MGWTILPEGGPGGPGGNPFERGQVDVFEIEGTDVGTLEKLGVKHDNKVRNQSIHIHIKSRSSFLITRI
jgi:hypothetical protein